MFYLKLKCKVTFQKGSRHIPQKSDVLFAIPERSFLRTSPDKDTKPLVMVNRIVGQATADEEKLYQVSNDKEILVETPNMNNWVGYTFRYKVSSCPCKGHRIYSFDLIEVLTKEEYNQTL